MVDLVFNDIDGCFGNFKKPKTFPGRQDLKGHKRVLGKIKRFVEANPSIKFAACTGRSLYLCNNIIEASGLNELSAVEMGQVIYHPLTKESYNLLDVLSSMGKINPETLEAGKELRDFIKNANSFEQELKEVFPNSGIKRMKDNVNMLTYEFKSRESGGITGEEVFAFLKPRLPSRIKEAIKTRGIKVVPSDTAVDVRLDLDKGHAIDYILEKLERTGEGCLGIGDSYHSDIDMMKRCEYVACPANSNGELKDYVNERKGYISKEVFGKGVIEIYTQLI